MFKRDRIQQLLSGLLCLGLTIGAITALLLKRQSETMIASDFFIPENNSFGRLGPCAAPLNFTYFATTE
jgi:hypothetical protein